MKYRIGDVVTGKVAGVQPYGAFVKLDEETQGLIHISECTNGYVSSVKDILTVDQDITVKILDIDEYSKKISLSIRALEHQEIIDSNKQHRKHFWTNKGNKIGYKSIADAKPGWIKEALDGLK